MNGTADDLAHEAFHRPTDAAMLPGQRRQRAARPLDYDVTVGFHVCKGTEMFVHQLAGFQGAGSETSPDPHSAGQYFSEPPAGFPKQCLQLIGWQSLSKDVD